MKYTALIERWKKETCEITVESDNPDDAEQQAVALYFGGHLEFETQNVKDEQIVIYDEDSRAQSLCSLKPAKENFA
ncbi:hypothetical protein [Serratia marcescens]|uniref:hypothetical protein n=1 Tax=Serratia marcescens TaxID=615 RepID=UPI001F15281C|nr:hypothetical protein [Serratia marcescens]